MLNKVQLIGHVGQDPEIRETPQGTKVADLRLATSRYWRDGEGNRQEETEWHRVVFWGKTAENVATVLAKGRLVYVEGRIQTRSWEDETGKHFQGGRRPPALYDSPLQSPLHPDRRAGRTLARRRNVRHRSNLPNHHRARAVVRVLLVLLALPIVLFAAIAGGALSATRVRPRF